MSEAPKFMTKNARMRHMQKRAEAERKAYSDKKAMEEYGESEISAGRTEYCRQYGNPSYAMADFIDAEAENA
ncbi:MAG: hypothetical protein QXU82_03365 [Candidatus Aenigmatarchaeota archaeon]